MYFRIYGHTQCKYCNMAKEELDKRGIPYYYHNTRESEMDAQVVRNVCWMKEIDPPTVPQIWICNGDTEVHIGGYTDLMGVLNDKDECASVYRKEAGST